MTRAAAAPLGGTMTLFDLPSPNTQTYRDSLLQMRDLIDLMLTEAPAPLPVVAPPPTPRDRAVLAVQAAVQAGLHPTELAVICARHPDWTYSQFPSAQTFFHLMRDTDPDGSNSISNKNKLSIIERALTEHLQATPDVQP